MIHDVSSVSSLVNFVPGMPPAFGGSFGFIRASLEDVARTAMAWRTELKFAPQRVDLQGGLRENAQRLLPLAYSPVFRDLFIATRGGTWTAYTNALLPSGDIDGPVIVIGQYRLHVPTMQVTAIPFQREPGSVAGRLGSMQFAFTSADSNKSRSVALVEGETSSSRYHFEEWGPVQPWEEPDRYRARRKRDRIDPALLDQYCRAIGIDPFDLDFYCGPSVLIERTRF